jgi:hypothetical protein
METFSPRLDHRGRSSLQTSTPDEAATIVKRVLKFIALLVASWCVMTFSHELGHIICGCACGGTLTDADLLPWHLPYSFFEPDPRPLVTLWGGPILGVMIPVAIAFVIRTKWIWFIAYFCMLANGSYIATAWVSGDRYLDTPKMLEHGAHPISIAIYCLLTIGFGYVGFRRHCALVLGDTRTVTPIHTNSTT